MCHTEAFTKLSCPKCTRSFHKSCVSIFKPRFKPGRGDEYSQFESECPFCTNMVIDNRRWSNFTDFEPISKKKLNICLAYILELIKQDIEPEPFLWPVEKFRLANSRINYLDVAGIAERCKKDYYASPLHFYNDVKIVIHCCMVLHANKGKLEIDYPTGRILSVFASKVNDFKNKVKQKVQYLEDCPHCIYNFTVSSQSWLTMACPWGHHLVFVNLSSEKKAWPAKLIRFNRSSERIDLILFGTAQSLFDHSRTRVMSGTVWIPSAADLIADPADSAELVAVKAEANQYLDVLRTKFKIKIEFGLRRVKITNLSKDYVSKPPPSEVIDIIDLADDDSDEAKNIASKSAEPGSKETDEDPKKVDESGSCDDEVIDEVLGSDESASISQINPITTPSKQLTTIVERVSQAPTTQSTSKSPSPRVPKSTTAKDVARPTRDPSPTPSTSRSSVSSKAFKQTETTTSTASTSQPAASTSTSAPVPVPSPPSRSQTPKLSELEQFSIFSDEEVDVSDEGVQDAPPEESGPPAEVDPLLMPDFVVESDQDNDDSDLVSKMQPIPVSNLSIGLEDSKDAFYERKNKMHHQRSSSSSSTESISPHESAGSGESSSKRIKLDDYFSSSQSFKIKRLEQQLEFAAKEKQLALDQINEVQEQCRKSLEIEETKVKAVESQFLSQIRILEESLSTEKTEKEKLLKENESLRKKLEEYEITQTKLKDQTSKVDQLNKKAESKNRELASLKAQLSEAEEKYKSLEENYNALLAKHENMKRTLKSLAIDHSETEGPSPKQSRKSN